MSQAEKFRRRLVSAEDDASQARADLEEASKAHDEALIGSVSDETLMKLRRVRDTAAGWLADCDRKVALLSDCVERAAAAEADARRIAAWQESDRRALAVRESVELFVEKLREAGALFAAVADGMEAYRVGLPRGGSNFPSMWSFDNLVHLAALELHRSSGQRFPVNATFGIHDARGLVDVTMDVLIQLSAHRPGDIPRSKRPALPAPRRRVAA